jgi:sulfate adenylyltransferase subunit 2
VTGAGDRYLRPRSLSTNFRVSGARATLIATMQQATSLADRAAGAPSTISAAAMATDLLGAHDTLANRPEASPRQGVRGSYLGQLEDEAVFVMREVAAQFERPVLLFSGGKDSIVLVRLARKAFWPGVPPFRLLHIDTGHNFPEVIAFRDRLAQEAGMELVVRCVQDSIDRGRVQEETGPFASRNALQSVTLLDALAELRVDAAVGGARRDEEKSRAKERFFSHRDRFGQWEPKRQRPEIWNLLNGRMSPGEHFRVFPISNWTELDVWRYIQAEEVNVPSLYFAHRREVVSRGGVLYARSQWVPLLAGERYEERQVRFRTVGDATCTGAVESTAATLEEIIREVAAASLTERGATRADDQRSEAAMEDRKRQGYF